MDRWLIKRPKLSSDVIEDDSVTVTAKDNPHNALDNIGKIANFLYVPSFNPFFH